MVLHRRSAKHSKTMKDANSYIKLELGQKESFSTKSIEMRTTVRLPQQLLFIRENPVTGWGFTDRFADPDTGNFGLLVQVGFIGFALFVFFWVFEEAIKR